MVSKELVYPGGRTERSHHVAVTGEVDMSEFKKLISPGHSPFFFSTSE